MTTLSEIESTSLTIKLAGISGNTRLDKESLNAGRCSSYVLIQPRNDEITAREVRENQNAGATDIRHG